MCRARRSRWRAAQFGAERVARAVGARAAAPPRLWPRAPLRRGVASFRGTCPAEDRGATGLARGVTMRRGEAGSMDAGVEKSGSRGRMALARMGSRGLDRAAAAGAACGWRSARGRLARTTPTSTMTAPDALAPPQASHEPALSNAALPALATRRPVEHAARAVDVAHGVAGGAADVVAAAPQAVAQLAAAAEMPLRAGGTAQFGPPSAGTTTSVRPSSTSSSSAIEPIRGPPSHA